MESPAFHFSIAATFTAQGLEAPVQFWGTQLKRQFEVTFAPYNQLTQTLLDPNGEFATNRRGLNILLARIEDLGEYAPGEWDVQRLEENAEELGRVVREVGPRLPSPVLLFIAPSSLAFNEDDTRVRFANRLIGNLGAALEGVTNVRFLHREEVDAWYPVAVPQDPGAETLARIPYTNLYFCALGTALVRCAHMLFVHDYKVIALDCDNTLWKGICGEEGPAGIELDDPRHSLQEFMRGQREAGMLLTLASKNNEQDVLDTFAQHPEMPLRFSDFAAARLNWESKAENLSSLAQELSLALDSFIFVDDNAKECAEVQASAPAVVSLALPPDEAAIPQFLRHVWAFDHRASTGEDRERSSSTAQTLAFHRESEQASDLAAFIEGLELKVTFVPLSEANLPRAAQLTRRTNQFNCTTIRRTEFELRELMNNAECDCLALEVGDRFGKYGITGLVIARVREGSLDVETFMLSCRVLGRGVEHRVLSYLGSEALRRGLAYVRVRFVPTERNLPARQFLELLPSESIQEEERGTSWVLSAAALPGYRWHAPVIAAGEAVEITSDVHARPSVDYAHIARALCTPELIYDAMRADLRSGRSAIEDAGMSETERQLAEIWADLLNVPAVRSEDNFFDRGGHSLLAVLLILRVKERFGLELAIEDVYDANLTLGGLAQQIDAYRTGDISPEEYRALLQQIESLSDDDVRELLAKEDAQSGLL